jgi:UDP-N-acetyl-D-galactosamine dehydrogenase
MEDKFISNPKIAIIGLGYVGLPLAVAFAEKYAVVGFDINEQRVDELSQGKDHTLEVDDEHLKRVLVNSVLTKGLMVSTQISDITDCTVFIVTVPTPTDKYNRPVLTPMIRATEGIALVLKPNDIVIYESTVYPGVTEEEMVPVLERVSGMKFNQDFYCGYSPERINPGDKEHTVTKILKVTSGSTPEVADYVDDLYKSIIAAGTHKASSIKVAEAAKVIENSQRDINIAFVNELAMIFNLMGIDTHEVLEAAGTKWNFLKFKPGLVGGHCIGVDPYYLAQKAQEVGYHPEIILAGRRVNDGMGKYVATEVVKLMMRKDIKVINSKVLIMGFTFKEDCPDFRNTKVIDIYNELLKFDINVDVYDPLANKIEVHREYQIEIFNAVPKIKYAAIIVAVAHKAFANIRLREEFHNAILFDVKGVIENADGKL